MYNFLLLIGRASIIEQKVSNAGKPYTELHIAVTRPFKNYEGQYDTDFFKIILFDNLAKLVDDYVTIGMLLAVKGRLQTNVWKDANDKTHRDIQIMAERFIFMNHDADTELADVNEA